MKQKVIAYGAGSFFRNHVEYLKKKYDIISVCDKNRHAVGKSIMGIPCISPEELNADSTNKVIITVMTPVFKEEIRNELNRRHMDEEEIFSNNENSNGKRVIIYGRLDECKGLDLILSCVSDVIVDSYCTHLYNQIGIDEVSNKKVISFVQAQNMVREGKVSYILACVEGFGFSLVSDIFDYDIRSTGLYIYDSKNDTDYEGKHVKFTDYRRLGTVQFLISPACNLNCKLCSHFSPLVQNREYYEYDRFEADLIHLSALVDRIDNLGLWGGETLLCPDLYRYVYKAKEIFPESTVGVGTNGMLLDRLDKELIRAMRETESVFCISLYPVIKDRFDSILSMLKKEKIRYFVDYDHLSPDPDNQFFFRRYDLNGDNDSYYSWKTCKSRRCHTIYKGKISGCYLPITSVYFNEYFKGEYFDTSGDCIDIHQEKSSSDLIKRLNSPMRSCRYCHYPQYEKWEIIGKKSDISDWVISHQTDGKKNGYEQ